MGYRILSDRGLSAPRSRRIGPWVSGFIIPLLRMLRCVMWVKPGLRPSECENCCSTLTKVRSFGGTPASRRSDTSVKIWGFILKRIIIGREITSPQTDCLPTGRTRQCVSRHGKRDWCASLMILRWGGYLGLSGGAQCIIRALAKESVEGQ